MDRTWIIVTLKTIFNNYPTVGLTLLLTEIKIIIYAKIKVWIGFFTIGTKVAKLKIFIKKFKVMIKKGEWDMHDNIKL